MTCIGQRNISHCDISLKCACVALGWLMCSSDSPQEGHALGPRECKFIGNRTVQFVSKRTGNRTKLFDVYLPFSLDSMMDSI